MGYVIAGVLVVLIIAGFILFLVTNATKKSNVSDAGDPGADQNPMGIVGSDDDDARRATPTEHARARPARKARRVRVGDARGTTPERRPRRSSAAKREGAAVRALTFGRVQGKLRSCWFGTQTLGNNGMSRRTDALHSPAGAPQPSSSVNGAPDRAPRLR